MIYEYNQRLTVTELGVSGRQQKQDASFNVNNLPVEPRSALSDLHRDIYSLVSNQTVFVLSELN